jgi:hypothetical protein
MQPIAFLDVDGPLNVYGALKTQTHLRSSVVEIRGCEYHVRLDPNHAKLVKQLADAGFELVWGTLWEDAANDHLLEHLVLDGPLPVVPFDAEYEMRLELPAPLSRKGLKFSQPDPWCTKAPAVLRYAADRPFVWFDDDFLPQDIAWAHVRSDAGIPTKLIPVGEDEGLQSNHIYSALDWLADLKTPEPEATSD